MSVASMAPAKMGAPKHKSKEIEEHLIRKKHSDPVHLKYSKCLRENKQWGTQRIMMLL